MTHSSTDKARAGAVTELKHAGYSELRQRLCEAGCFQPAYAAYGLKTALTLAALALGFAMLLGAPGWPLRLGLLAFLAFASIQAAFLGHDASDGAITGNRRASHWLGQFLMSFVSAMSSSYFRYLHKVHHLTVHRGAGGLGSGDFVVNPFELAWLKRLLSGNGMLFMAATIALRGLMFRLESARFVLNKRNWNRTGPDRMFMVLHALVWLVVPVPFIGLADTVINYSAIMLLSGPYIGLVLVLNHEGMSKAGSLRHLPVVERVTETTRNLGNSFWSDLVFGGVNNHIEHHLFPHIPAMRLGQARRITRTFCRENGIRYVETGFAQALAEAIRYFRSAPSDRLARQALS